MKKVNQNFMLQNKHKLEVPKNFFHEETCQRTTEK